jgi:dTDP-4-amino-4,6-dideoxygalactose transaminase
MHPYWRDTYNLSEKNFPISQQIYENSISLPIYSMMTKNDTERVIFELKKYL